MRGRAAGRELRSSVGPRGSAIATAAILVLILAGGGWLRLSGADWDRGSHLHPDERYISSVANVIRWPDSPTAYLDVGRSPLSPYGTEEGLHYSYGTLPLFSIKAVADLLGRGDYDNLYLVGRRLTAVLDLATTLLVFVLARMVLSPPSRRRRTGGALLAAALYAVTVAAVQASHFATTDLWLTFFSTLTLVFAAVAAGAARSETPIPWLAAAGVGIGLATACKASGLFATIPVLVVLVALAATSEPRRWWRRAGQVALNASAVALPAYLAFRLASPYSFASSNWLDPRLAQAYRVALAEQRNILDGRAIYPPTLQWLLSSRVVDPLQNLLTWQLGIPLGVCTLMGIAAMVVTVARSLARAVRDRGDVSPPGADQIGVLVVRIMVLVYVVVVFLYVSTRFQHMGRYLLPIVPLLAVLAAFGLVALFNDRRLLAGSAALLLVLTAAYATAFHAVYASPTTRLAASSWIARNVPAGARIVNENWDDTLPVGAGPAARYRTSIAPVFDEDDGGKLDELYRSLAPADVYVVSSPRAWRTIGRLPDRYPLMVRYYRQLFAGRLGFRPVASFTSHPRLLGVELDDLAAEEAFWVYDHPPVTIFRRDAPLSLHAFRAALCESPAPSACG